MTKPGFTADYALIRTIRHYHISGGYYVSFMKGRKVMESEQMNTEPELSNNLQVSSQSTGRDAPEPLIPQQDQLPCPTCGSPMGMSPNSSAIPSFVYALGRIEPRFPSISVEKEFAQVTGKVETTGLTDRQTVHKVLTQPENRYLIRQLCWVMTIQELETYILIPHDPISFDLLAQALRRDPGPLDLDVIIGVRGPLAPPEMCNGLVIPIVAFDQIYSFDRDSFIESIPRPEGISEDEFRATSSEVFDRIIRIVDNAGAIDEHRALNYLAVRYPAIYQSAAQSFRENASLTEVEVRPSRLSGARTIVDVVFSYTHRQTGVTDKYFVRVDVTEEFPFLVTKLSPFFDR